MLAAELVNSLKADGSQYVAHLQLSIWIDAWPHQIYPSSDMNWNKTPWFLLLHVSSLLDARPQQLCPSCLLNHVLLFLRSWIDCKKRLVFSSCSLLLPLAFSRSPASKHLTRWMESIDDDQQILLFQRVNEDIVNYESGCHGNQMPTSWKKTLKPWSMKKL